MRQIWAFILLSAVAAGSGRAADVARIGTNTYPSLDAAVAAAQSNDTVVLMGNAILTNTISIAVPLSIVSDGSVRTISRTNAVEGMDLIWVHSPGSLTLGQASGNDATPDLILDGGAVGSVTGGYSFIFAESANVTVQPGVVLQHYTGLYAPLYMLDYSTLATLVLNGGLFTGNSAANSSGGCICSQGASIHARNAVFVGNAAPHGRGGAIYMEYATLEATNLTVSGNSADDYGGGVMAYPGTVVLTGGTFSGNRAINGGGIANANGNVTATGTAFSSNRAFYGGAIWSHTSTNVFQSASFRGNQATNFGAGLYSTSSRYTLTNCEIIANAAGSNGGGIYVSPATNPPTSIAIASSTISSNSGLYGGAVYSSYADLAIAGSTLAGNQVSGAGGALWLFGSTTLRDTAVARNSATNEGGGIFHLGGPLSLSGQTRLEGNVGATGKGIWCFNGFYEGTNAVLSLSEGVSIAADNDVSLQTVTNAILLAGTLFAPGTVATIVPAIYSNGLPVLRDAAGLSFSPVARYYGKFAVAPQTNAWYVGTNGNLAAAAPPAPPAPPAEWRDIVSLGAPVQNSTFQFSVDAHLLEYDFALQGATAVVGRAWNFQTLTNGYAVSTNGLVVLDAAPALRIYRLVSP